MVTHPVILATLWMTGTLASFMAMAVSGRELSGHMGTFEILLLRSIIGLVVIVLCMGKTGFHHIHTRRIGLHTIRNTVHFGGQLGWFYGIACISLAEVFAIEFTVPIWTALMARLLLNEPLTRSRITAVILGIAGMLVILRPGLSVIHPASLAVLAGAVCYALSHTLTRRLVQSDTPMTVLFYMTLIQLPFGLVPAIGSWVTPSWPLMPWIIGVGVTSLMAHFCMAKALTLADATLVVPMDFLRLPLIALVGFLFYNETIDGFVFLGAVMMLTGNYINIRTEQKGS